MPPLHFAILIGAVIAAAGLTVALIAGLLTPVNTIMGLALMTGLLILRALMMRK